MIRRKYGSTGHHQRYTPIGLKEIDRHDLLNESRKKGAKDAPGARAYLNVDECPGRRLRDRIGSQASEENSAGQESRRKDEHEGARGSSRDAGGPRRGPRGDRVGGMEGDRSSGQTDGRKDRQDWRPLITGGACARNAAALVSSIQ